MSSSLRVLGRLVSKTSARASVILRAPVRIGGARALSSSIAETPSSPVVPAAGATPIAEPVAATSTLWTKLVAFCGGIAVGGAYFIYLNYTDNWRGGQGATDSTSPASNGAELASFADLTSRRRLAALEHEVATLRTEIEARA